MTYSDKKNIFISAVIVAAGMSSRMGKGISKQLLKIDDTSVISKSICAFQESENIDEIIIVCRPEEEKVIESDVKNNNFTKVKKIVYGGSTRQQSVFNGVKAINNNSDYVAIHDGARAFIKTDDIDKTIDYVKKFKAVALAVKMKSTIKIADQDDFIVSTPNRNTLRIVQTPQVFEKNLYLKAMQKAIADKNDYTDDCQLIEALGMKVKLVEGSYSNIKITTKEDIPTDISKKIIKIGHGYDVHKFAKDRKLILGGIEIQSDLGLLGHSDADVLTHSVMDALLGAAGMRDIGYYFPDTDSQYKNATSTDLLKVVCRKIQEKNFHIVNIDVTVIAQYPKISGYVDSMKNHLCDICSLDNDQINIKATTEEGLGFTGRKEGIASHCVCLIEKYQ